MQAWSSVSLMCERRAVMLRAMSSMRFRRLLAVRSLHTHGCLLVLSSLHSSLWILEQKRDCLQSTCKSAFLCLINLIKYNFCNVPILFSDNRQNRLLKNLSRKLTHTWSSCLISMEIYCLIEYVKYIILLNLYLDYLCFKEDINWRSRTWFLIQVTSQHFHNLMAGTFSHSVSYPTIAIITFIIWQALWTNKRNQILHCDWLRKWALWKCPVCIA